MFLEVCRRREILQCFEALSFSVELDSINTFSLVPEEPTIDLSYERERELQVLRYALEREQWHIFQRRRLESVPEAHDGFCQLCELFLRFHSIGTKPITPITKILIGEVSIPES